MYLGKLAYQIHFDANSTFKEKHFSFHYNLLRNNLRETAPATLLKKDSGTGVSR